jgi:hypothetical protein
MVVSGFIPQNCWILQHVINVTGMFGLLIQRNNMLKVNSSFDTSLGALYGPSILTYRWPMHYCTVVNAFKGTVNLKAAVLDGT